MIGIPLTEKELKEMDKALHAFDNLESEDADEKPDKEEKKYKAGELFI